MSARWLKRGQREALQCHLEAGQARGLFDSWETSHTTYEEGIGYGRVKIRWVIIDLNLSGEVFRLGLQLNNVFSRKVQSMAFNGTTPCCNSPALMDALIVRMDFCSSCKEEVSLAPVTRELLEARLSRALDPLVAVLRAHEMAEWLDGTADLFGLASPLARAVAAQASAA